MESAIRVQIDSALSSFRWNEAEYTRLLTGAVMANLVKRAIRVENQMKRNATNESVSPPGHGPGVVTGRLRGSITWRPGIDAVSPYVDIGTAVFYAPFLELGTSKMAARPFMRSALEAARIE